MPVLALRSRSAEDLPYLYRWLHAEPNPEWQHWDGPYFHEQQPKSSVSFETYAGKATVQPANPDMQVMALDGQCIGTVTRYEEDPAGGGWWELGIVIHDPAYWSGGHGTQALHQWTVRTLADTAAHVLTLSTWSGNQRMIRAAQRVGYRECARIPEARSWNGQRWDSIKLALLRHEVERTQP